MIAVYKEMKEVLAVLLSYGADVSLQNQVRLFTCLLSSEENIHLSILFASPTVTGRLDGTNDCMRKRVLGYCGNSS